MQFIIIFCSCFLLDIISECGIISMKKSCISQEDAESIQYVSGDVGSADLVSCSRCARDAAESAVGCAESRGSSVG